MPALRIGLYDSNDAEVTSGELNSQDYWWTKFDAMMLEIALKQHQPEGHIGVDLASSIRRVDDLLKKYPKHEEIFEMEGPFRRGWIQKSTPMPAGAPLFQPGMSVG